MVVALPIEGGLHSRNLLGSKRTLLLRDANQSEDNLISSNKKSKETIGCNKTMDKKKVLNL